MGRVSIENYKSIARTDLELSPLTILVGPPGGGKSNIMEALSLVGLIGRFFRYVLGKSGQDSALDSLEQTVSRERRIINSLIRTKNYEEIFYYSDVTRVVNITFNPLKMSFKIKHGDLHSSVNISGYLPGLNHRFISNKDVKLLLSNIIQYYIIGCLYKHYKPVKDIYDKIRSALDKLVMLGGADIKELSTGFPEIRLYGYERFGVNTRINEIMSYNEPSESYKYTLLEDASNIASILNIATDVLDKINEWLDSLGTGLKVIYDKRRMEPIFFKEPVSLTPSLVSDAVLRMIYYLAALRSAVTVKKIYDAKTNIVMLEEPGAHVFPYSFEVLGEAIKNAVNNGVYVVISTHNNLLVSKLWDLLPREQITTYYVFEKPRKGTVVIQLPMDKLAEKLMTSFEIMIMRPAELLRELNISLDEETL